MSRATWSTASTNNNRRSGALFEVKAQHIKLFGDFEIRNDGNLWITFYLDGTNEDVILHFGVCTSSLSDWKLPEQSTIKSTSKLWSVGTAMQTEFVVLTERDQRSMQCTQMLQISFTNSNGFPSYPLGLQFVLHLPPDRWIKENGCNNFVLPLQQLVKEAQAKMELKEYIDKMYSSTNLEDVETVNWTITSKGTPINLSAVLWADVEGCNLHMYANFSASLLLHWGFSTEGSKEWTRPDAMHFKAVQQLPAFSGSPSHPWDDKAMQTYFEFVSTDGKSSIQQLNLKINGEVCPPAICFVLKEQNSNQWYSYEEGDFYLPLASHPKWKDKKMILLKKIEEDNRIIEEKLKAKQQMIASVFDAFKASREERVKRGTVMFRTYVIEGIGEIDVDVSTTEERDQLIVQFVACLTVECKLHWGVLNEVGFRAKKVGGTTWRCPPEGMRPPNTVVVDPQRACQTTFKSDDTTHKILQKLEIIVPSHATAVSDENDMGIDPEVEGIAFVLKEVDGHRWFKGANSDDLQIRLLGGISQWKGSHSQVVEGIVRAEVEWTQMTLMHRYDLLSDYVYQWEHHKREESVYGEATLQHPWTSFEDEMKRLTSSSNSNEFCVASPTPEEEESHEFWSWIYVWSRFSSMRLLDWQRNYNTKPRELSAVMEKTTLKMAAMWKTYPKYRHLIRSVLGTMSRGGNKGQAIRDKILDILHKNRIAEHKGNFYEQWHQKLHNNTTPDDIYICKAVIEFLESGGNLHRYWEVLSENGISKERLASYERPIVTEPHTIESTHSLIGDMKEYLSILQDVHDALDLKKAFGYCRPYLDTEIYRSLETLLASPIVSTLSQMTEKRSSKNNIEMKQNDMHNHFMKISELRKRIIVQLNDKSTDCTAVRELLFLDMSLEQQQNVVVQSGCPFNISQLASQIYHMLLTASGHDPTNTELWVILCDWHHLFMAASTSTYSSTIESYLLLDSLADRLIRTIGGIADAFQSSFGLKSQYLGSQVGVDKKRLNIFVDECIRGSMFLSMSFTLKNIRHLIRRAAKLPPWQFISAEMFTRGYIKRIDGLHNIQDTVYSTPTILICDAVSGDEEIPLGVVGVIVRSAVDSPDMLSHVAVRARNARILFCVCCEEQLIADIEAKYTNEFVRISVSRDESSLVIEKDSHVALTRKLSISESQLVSRSPSTHEEDPIGPDRKASFEENYHLTEYSKLWAVNQMQFNKELVGSKSLNLLKLHDKLKQLAVLPRGVAIPFGVMEKTLRDPMNDVLVKKMEELLSRLKPTITNGEADEIFKEIRYVLLKETQLPPALLRELHDCIQHEDERSINAASSVSMTSLIEEADPSIIFKCITTVWASLYSLRPWIGLSKAGKLYSQLTTAVLIQEVMPASYAFVLHSRNPSTNNNNEMYGELVVGLGEVLVGNYVGRAMSWTMKRNGEPTVVSFASKSIALKCKRCLIFRSDSNAEDLEGFAGAGLFESVTYNSPVKLWVRYAELRILKDLKYRQYLLKKIGDLSFQIEDIFGSPQDIEGVVTEDDTIAVVQSRPQV